MLLDFFSNLSNTASSATPQILLCRRIEEPRTDATSALAVTDTLISWLDLIYTRLNLIHTRLDLIHTCLDLIHTRLDLIHNSARSHPQLGQIIHIRLDRIQNSARSHPHSSRSSTTRLISSTLGQISSTTRLDLIKQLIGKVSNKYGRYCTGVPYRTETCRFLVVTFRYVFLYGYRVVERIF